MADPCKSCDRKTVDFGGCRCQAMAIVGDASATDPVCRKSPHHAALQTQANTHAAQTTADLIYRTAPGKTPAPVE